MFRKKKKTADIFGFDRNNRVYTPDFAKRKTFSKKYTINNGESRTIDVPIIVGKSLKSLTIISDKVITIRINEAYQNTGNKNYVDVELAADTPYSFNEEIFTFKMSNASGTNAIIKAYGSIRYDGVTIEK